MVFGLTGLSNAALILNDDLITVTETRGEASTLMWTRDANLADTLGWTPPPDGGTRGNGIMNWAGANAWIDYLNSIQYAGYDDWRLPYTQPNNGVSYHPDFWNIGYDGTNEHGYNVTNPNSEMAYLFNELGNIHYFPTDYTGPSNPGDPPDPDFYSGQEGWEIIYSGPYFENIQAGFYWSEYNIPEGIPEGWAWSFNFQDGY